MGKISFTLGFVLHNNFLDLLASHVKKESRGSLFIALRVAITVSCVVQVRSSACIVLMHFLNQFYLKCLQPILLSLLESKFSTCYIR